MGAPIKKFSFSQGPRGKRIEFCWKVGGGQREPGGVKKKSPMLFTKVFVLAQGGGLRVGVLNEREKKKKKGFLFFFFFFSKQFCYNRCLEPRGCREGREIPLLSYNDMGGGGEKGRARESK